MEILKAIRTYRDLSERIHSILTGYNGNRKQLYDSLVGVLESRPYEYKYEGEWFKSTQDGWTSTSVVVKEILREQILEAEEVKRYQLSVSGSGSFGYTILGDNYSAF